MVEVVFLGDDFTGASDSLASYAGRGLATRLALDPAADTAHGLDALGLPTDLRSLPPERARAVVAHMWPAIARADPRIIHFKVCSTFDSSPAIGSIGAVVDELRARFAPDVVAVVGGQPSLGRYLAFGNLFARGPDGAVHRIDRHPVMSRHPVTPMAEADLARHLAAQGLEGLAPVTGAALDDAAGVLEMVRAGPVLFDVMTEADQARIGAVLRRAGGRQLLIGASSVAEILGQGAVRRSAASPIGPADPPRFGNVLAFAGSRSVTTARQVEAARAYHKVPLSAAALASVATIEEAAAQLAEGRPVLVHLLPDEAYGLAPDALADASCAFLAELMGRADVGHLALAGGDTSSRICARLGFDGLDFERRLGAGVCVCVAAHADPRRDRMRVLLKGGQMGAPDLFDRFAALAASAGAPHPDAH